MQTGQRPSMILREEELIDDEPGIWNLMLDAMILSEITPSRDGSLSGEIENTYRKYGIKVDE